MDESYRAAKAKMLCQWSSPSVLCAVCGLIVNVPVCHHWLESRRFDKCSPFNLAPVHGQSEAGCHTEAHTKRGKLIVANAVYLVWGKGNRWDGRIQIMEAVDAKGYREPPPVPPISNEPRVREVCERIAVRFGWRA